MAPGPPGPPGKISIGALLGPIRSRLALGAGLAFASSVLGLLPGHQTLHDGIHLACFVKHAAVELAHQVLAQKSAVATGEGPIHHPLPIAHLHASHLRPDGFDDSHAAMALDDGARWSVSC